MSGDLKNTYALLLKPGVLQLLASPLESDLPSRDYVRLQIVYCGLCGSDLAFYQGRPHAQYPCTLGHEHIGVVVAVGEDVTNVLMGDAVAVDPNYRCGSCFYCKSNASNLCEVSEKNLFTYRGFSTFTDLHFSYLHPIPEFKPPYLGGLIEPLSCALHALERANVRPNDNLLILGAGSQGTLLTFALSVLFPELSLEVYDPNRDRSARLTTCFPRVSALADPPSADRYSLIFEASGQTQGFHYATNSLSKAGRIVVISRYNDAQEAYLPYSLPRKEGTLVFSHLNGNGEPFDQAIQLLSNNWSEAFNSLLEIRPFRELDDAIRSVAASSYGKTIIEINPSLLK